MKNLMKLCGRGLVASLLALVLCAGAVQAQVNAYVTNAGLGTLSVIDTATNTVTATVPVEGEPILIAIDPVRRLAYVGTDFPDTVTVIDLVTNTVVAVVPTSDDPLALALSANGDFAYVGFGNGNSNRITVIDTATNTVATDLPVAGDGAFALVLAPDGSIWSGDFTGVVSVIDTATNTITSTFAAGDYWLDAAFTPDGAFAYLPGTASSNTSVLDVATKTVVATIPTGFFQFRNAITPDGAFAYVPAQGSESVFVIDTATNTVAATIPIPGFSVAITPDGAFAYVTAGDYVEVIDTATHTVVATIPVVGSFDIAIAGQATPQDQIASLIAEINALVTGGTLASNKANPLITRLESVSDKLDAAQVGAACNQLGAFINQVDAYIGNGTLMAAQGQELIDATNALRANLGC